MARHTRSLSWEPRVDRGELLAAHRRADGTLLVEGFAARAGVLEYRRGGRIVRELVREDTLARAARGLARAPVTLGHPDRQRYPRGVTPDNVEVLGVGDTDGEVAVGDGGFTRVRLAVRRRDALDAVDAGTHELSPGYDAAIDPTPGEHPVYGRYDQEQVERAYNHLAIVDRARGGREIGFRADADAGVATTVISAGGSSPGTTTHTGAKPQGASVNPRFLPLLTLLGVTSRVDSDDAAIDAACSALAGRQDSASKAEIASKAALDAEKARADAEKARADTAERELTKLRDAEKARADAAGRAELEGLAKALKVDPAKHADVGGLRRAVAVAHLGGELRADASDDYVRALVDLAKAGQTQRADGSGREAGRQAWQAPGAGASGTQRADAKPPPRRSGRSVFDVARKRYDARDAGGDA